MITTTLAIAAFWLGFNVALAARLGLFSTLFKSKPEFPSRVRETSSPR